MPRVLAIDVVGSAVATPETMLLTTTEDVVVLVRRTRPVAVVPLVRAAGLMLAAAVSEALTLTALSGCAS